MTGHISTSDTVVVENPEASGSPALDASGSPALDASGSPALDATAGLASAAAVASAESREILNLLGDSEAAGSCCGGSCCS